MRNLWSASAGKEGHPRKLVLPGGGDGGSLVSVDLLKPAGSQGLCFCRLSELRDCPGRDSAPRKAQSLQLLCSAWRSQLLEQQ